MCSVNLECSQSPQPLDVYTFSRYIISKKYPNWNQMKNITKLVDFCLFTFQNVICQNCHCSTLQVCNSEKLHFSLLGSETPSEIFSRLRNFIRNEANHDKARQAICPCCTFWNPFCLFSTETRPKSSDKLLLQCVASLESCKNALIRNEPDHD